MSVLKRWIFPGSNFMLRPGKALFAEEDPARERYKPWDCGSMTAVSHLFQAKELYLWTEQKQKPGHKPWFPR